MEIRAYWWVHQLQRATTQEERRYYTLCLASIRDSSLHALPALLNDPRPEMRVLGIEALRECRSLRARDLLLNALRDDSDPVVVRAALMLSLRPDRKETLGRLWGGTSENPRLASAMIFAIERVGSPDDADRLLHNLTPSSDPNVLAQAIDSLANLNCRTEFRFLVGRLADQRPVTVPPFSYRMAIEALARLQGGEVAKGVDKEALLAATQAPKTVGATAARSLYMLTGQSFGDPATQPAEGGRAIQHLWYEWLDRYERGSDTASTPAETRPRQ